MALRWQDHSEPSEWVNYWAVWFTYTIENKPSLDNNLHFLSAWINAPQIAVFTVFAIRTPGQRCRAAHQYCSLGTEWLYIGLVSLTPECCCTVIPGWAGARESLWVWAGRGILWSPSEYVPGASSCAVLQPCFSSQAPWAVDITANGPFRLYGLKYWWYGICAQVGLDGLLPFIPRGRKKNAKEVFTYTGNMTTVINPRLYRNSFCI